MFMPTLRCEYAQPGLINAKMVYRGRNVNIVENIEFRLI